MALAACVPVCLPDVCYIQTLTKRSSLEFGFSQRVTFFLFSGIVCRQELLPRPPSESRGPVKKNVLTPPPQVKKKHW
ncbi:hypothetical protein XELAEV_18046868mg [Xenopus laevis]|uniref:Uncharacterized protein n=1 Tax=Xenopus laevis TaxID=8355 RepID=A0A974H192_XENLA|nr:hypothetical protein XELAEV_18046868mg [Xenopus laevis]